MHARGESQFVTGPALAPLSPRDMWLLSRVATFLVEMIARPLSSVDPEDWRFRRHALDWLRVPSDAGPYWVHTHRGLDAEMEYGTSDQDDSFIDFSSDQDDELP